MVIEHKLMLNRLKILQLNLNKSQKAHLNLINGPLGNNWDLILIQELYITPLSHIRTPNGFTIISLQDRFLDNTDQPRSVTWVNSKLSTNTWKTLNIPRNNNIMVLQIKTPAGRLSIFNIYNNCTHSRTLLKLKQYIQEERQQIMASDRDMVLWGGDFNQHHPLRDNNEDKRLFAPQALRKAEVLISLLADEGLVMALPRGATTLKHMVTNLYSRADNVWCSERLIWHILCCEVDIYLQPPCTDHFPIVIIVDIPRNAPWLPHHSTSREVDWEAFQNQL